MKSLDESVVGWCADRYDEKIAKYVKSVTDSIGNFQLFIKITHFSVFTALINVVIVVNIIFLFLEIGAKSDPIKLKFSIKEMSSKNKHLWVKLFSLVDHCNILVVSFCSKTQRVRNENKRITYRNRKCCYFLFI